jgi:uncharacterized membrane protein
LACGRVIDFKEAIVSEIIVVAFSDKAGADKGSVCLKKLITQGITVYRSAILSKNSEGRIFVSDRVDEKSYTTLVTALIGGLAGLPAGLEAAVAGAAGGALFGICAELTHRGAHNQLIEKVSRELEWCKFAIVVEIASEDVESFERCIRDIGGTMTHPIRG